MCNPHASLMMHNASRVVDCAKRTYVPSSPPQPTVRVRASGVRCPVVSGPKMDQNGTRLPQIPLLDDKKEGSIFGQKCDISNFRHPSKSSSPENKL